MFQCHLISSFLPNCLVTFPWYVMYWPCRRHSHWQSETSTGLCPWSAQHGSPVYFSQGLIWMVSSLWKHNKQSQSTSTFTGHENISLVISTYSCKHKNAQSYSIIFTYLVSKKRAFSSTLIFGFGFNFPSGPFFLASFFFSSFFLFSFPFPFFLSENRTI